jgi:O-antigen/teichoic acid export membrane protein
MITRENVRRIAPARLIPLLDRVERSTLGLRLAHGMFWSLVGAVSSRALGVAASILLARILGRTVFGEWGIIQSTSNLFLTFAESGLGLTATKYVAECRREDPGRAGRIMAMSVTLAVVSGAVVSLIMVATSGVAARLMAAPHLPLAIAISALAVLVITINEAQNGILSGLEAFKTRSNVQFFGAMLSLPISVLGALRFGLLGAVWALVVSQALVAALNYRAVQREARSANLDLRWGEIWSEMGVLTRFSLPTLCAGAVYVPSMWLANMILVNSPGGYGEMGIFTAADRWRTAILFLPSLLGGVVLPMLASLQGEGASSTYQRLLWANIKLSAALSLAAAAPIALLAPFIMGSYGPGFRQGTWVLVTLCSTSIVFAVYWIVGQSMLSRGHVWTMFCFNLGWGATLLVSEWLLRGHGAKGLALAYLLAETGRMTAAIIYASRMRETRRSPLPVG